MFKVRSSDCYFLIVLFFNCCCCWVFRFSRSVVKFQVILRFLEVRKYSSNNNTTSGNLKGFISVKKNGKRKLTLIIQSEFNLRTLFLSASLKTKHIFCIYAWYVYIVNHKHHHVKQNRSHILVILQVVEAFLNRKTHKHTEVSYFR